MAGNIKVSSKAVIDASMALAFLFPDEKKTKADSLFQAVIEQRIKIFAPDIFYYEVFNGIKSAVLSTRISKKTAKELLANFLKIKIFIEKTNYLETFELACKKNLSFYDASYLFLSSKLKIPLFTFDKLLLKLEKKS